MGPGLDQPAVEKARQVLGDCRLRETEMLREVDYPVLTEGQVPQDGQARWITEAPEQAGRGVKGSPLVDVVRR